MTRKWQGPQPALTQEQVDELELMRLDYAARRDTMARINELALEWGVNVSVLRRYLRTGLPKRYIDREKKD